MSDRTKLNPLAVAIGTTFAVSLAASPIVNAADNPFSATGFSNGYMVAEGNCGDKKSEEGKCGDKKKEEGKCGDKKSEEGKCGSKGDDMKDEHGMTSDEKSKEGKCGEAKCGANKK